MRKRPIQEVLICSRRQPIIPLSDFDAVWIVLAENWWVMDCGGVVVITDVQAFSSGILFLQISTLRWPNFLLATKRGFFQIRRLLPLCWNATFGAHDWISLHLLPGFVIGKSNFSGDFLGNFSSYLLLEIGLKDWLKFIFQLFLSWRLRQWNWWYIDFRTALKNALYLVPQLAIEFFLRYPSVLGFAELADSLVDTMLNVRCFL